MTKLFFIKCAFLMYSVAIILSGCNNTVAKNNPQPVTIAKDTTPKVIGIGGIFFKSKDPGAAKDWYTKNLGIAMAPYGAIFESKNANAPHEANYLSWAVFNEKTSYFKPSEKEFMINYRVQNLEGLIRNFRKNGVTVVDTIQKVDYGKFVHIMDADGNKIELWEPVDSVLTKIGGTTNK